MFYCLPRFISSPLNESRRPGPASRCLYLDTNSEGPDVLQTSSFRLELSRAFSLTHLLTPHAIVYSYLEGRIFWEYRDQNSYDMASQLYLHTYMSPYQDLTQSYNDVYRGWESKRRLQVIYDTQELFPVKKFYCLLFVQHKINRNGNFILDLRYWMVLIDWYFMLLLCWGLQFYWFWFLEFVAFGLCVGGSFDFMNINSFTSLEVVF